jgi:hypothetical protein
LQQRPQSIDQPITALAGMNGAGAEESAAAKLR